MRRRPFRRGPVPPLSTPVCPARHRYASPQPLAPMPFPCLPIKNRKGTGIATPRRKVCCHQRHDSWDAPSCHFDRPAMSRSPHASRDLPPAGEIPVRHPQRAALPSLADAVQKQLRESPYFALRSLRCHAEGESLVLEGRVGSYYLKQLASAVAQRVSEGCLIDNRLEVVTGTSVFWLEEEEPSIDPLSGRRRWQTADAHTARAAVPTGSQPA